MLNQFTNTLMPQMIYSTNTYIVGTVHLAPIGEEKFKERGVFAARCLWFRKSPFF